MVLIEFVYQSFIVPPMKLFRFYSIIKIRLLQCNFEIINPPFNIENNGVF